MASSIDDTKPAAGNATTGNVRANFTAAKNEIEALQTDKTAVADLANDTDAAKGDALSGYRHSATGAVARTVHDRLADGGISINEFSPNADGVTEDQAAFELAAATGKPILLDPGATYLINTNVSGMINGSGFLCVGGRATIKSTLTSTLNIFSCTGKSDQIFQNIDFDLPIPANAYFSIPINVITATNFIIDNCSSTDGTHLAQIFGGTNVHVTRNTVANPDSYGLIFAGSQNGLWAHNNHCYGSILHDGIKVAGSATAEAPVHKKIFIYANDCHDNNRDGIDAAVNDGEDIHIFDNSLNDNGLQGCELKLLLQDPIKLKNSSIHHNTINVSAASASGLVVNCVDPASQALMYDLDIENNTIRCSNTTDQTGIKVFSGTRIKTSKNKIYQGIDGVRHLGAIDCSIVDNEMYGCANMYQLSTDGTNAPTDGIIKGNYGKDIVSRDLRVTDASTTGFKVGTNPNDAPISLIAGTTWQFGNNGFIKSTANKGLYASAHQCSYSNGGTAGNITFTLNDNVEGLEYTFTRTDAFQINVSPLSGVIILGGTISLDMYLATALGDSVTIRCMNSTTWAVIASNGTVSFI